MVRHLITSIVASRQASVLLLTNADQMAEHRVAVDRIMADAHQGALLAPRERDSFNLEESPLLLAMGDLNPCYSGLVFPGSEPEKPDLSSLIMDSTIPQEVRERIHLAVEMSHQENVRKVQALDQKFRGLYTTVSGLVNDSMEAIHGYGKVASALDIRQQVIVRRSGPFVKPTASKAGGKQLKPGAKPVPSCAVSSAQSASKKKRSRGKGRKTQGLPAHTAPPPNPPAPVPRSAPASRDKPRFQSMDIWVKQGLLPPNTLSSADLRNHLEQRQHSSREGEKVPSQAKSLGARSKDRGGVGQQGGSQSSSHHRGSSQGHSGSSSRSGPPRPPPSSTATSGSQASASYAQVTAKGTKSPPDQGKRSAERDRSRDSKVRYLTVEVSWGSSVNRWYFLGIG